MSHELARSEFTEVSIRVCKQYQCLAHMKPSNHVINAGGYHMRFFLRYNGYRYCSNICNKTLSLVLVRLLPLPPNTWKVQLLVAHRISTNNIISVCLSLNYTHNI